MDNYIKDALRTEPDNYDDATERLSSPGMTRTLHAAMGVVTESAELLDAVKKHVYYGKPLDRVNLAEEAGDLFWYLAILCNELGTSFEDVMATNIAKLKARYPNNFTSHDAIHRDLEREHSILSKGGYLDG